MLKNEIQSNVYSLKSRMITPFHHIIRSIFIPSFVLFRGLRLYTKIFHLCFFHFEGYLVRIIIVTSLFLQDLNISESNLSLSSDGIRGTAPTSCM
jgi:hypothetical protein